MQHKIGKYNRMHRQQNKLQITTQTINININININILHRILEDYLLWNIKVYFSHNLSYKIGKVDSNIP